ncbi:MAG: hypothetical protein JST92_01975 [Deltaproteobacteria bacterium]|nr:hypothetical protein [Deltaproteobacteria bacterium]
MKTMMSQAKVALVMSLVWAAAPVQAAPPAKTTAVAPVPFLALPGASDELAAKVSLAVISELKSRNELKVIELPDDKGDPKAAADKLKADAQKASETSRTNIGKAAELFKKGSHAKAAAALDKAVKAMLANPLTVDEAGGKLLADATLQLAVARVITGDEDGADLALTMHVRWAPELPLDAANYPPAFVRAFEAARGRLLGSPRATIKVLAPPGVGETRVLFDGRPLRAAPVQLTDVLPGVHVVRVERGAEAWAEAVDAQPGADAVLVPRFLPPPGPSMPLATAIGRGEIDKAAAKVAGKLMKQAGAQAVLLGAVSKEGDGFTVRPVLVLEKRDKVLALAPIAVDAELLSASLSVLRLVDEIVAKLNTPPAESPLPVLLGSAVATEELAQVPTAPQPPEGVAQAPQQASTGPQVSQAAPIAGSLDAAVAAAVKADAGTATQEPSQTQAQPPVAAQEPQDTGAGRRVALPGQKPPPIAAQPKPEAKPEAMPEAKAEAKPEPKVEQPEQRAAIVPKAPEEQVVAQANKPAAPPPAPGRNLVIPRQATDPDDEVTTDKPRQAPAAATRIEALEANQVATVHEEPTLQASKKNHAALWIVAGVLVAGGLGVGGYFLYENSRTAQSATVTATWSH